MSDKVYTIKRVMGFLMVYPLNSRDQLRIVTLLIKQTLFSGNSYVSE